MTVSGNQKRKMRSASRLYAVQALFQMEKSAQTVEQICNEFIDHRFGATLEGSTFEEGDIDHFKLVLDNAVNHQAVIDQATDRGLVAKWPIARIDPTIRAVFRAACAELHANTAPPRVLIKEYVDLAGAFFPDGKEPRFVNAVLDHIARDMRPELFSDQ